MWATTFKYNLPFIRGKYTLTVGLYNPLMFGSNKVYINMNPNNISPN